MLANFSILLPLLSIIFTILLAIGGFFAYRQGFSSTASDIQEKVINALKAQNEAQERQLETCEKEIARLKSLVSTIQIALKRRGLLIEINGDSITLIDNQGTRAHTVKISIDNPESATMPISPSKRPKSEEDS